MKEMNNSEDLFDSFIRTVLSSLPLMYVLINITLLIWMAQIIFSSNLVLVPRSIYLISPLFSEYPLCDLLVIDAQSGE